MAPGFLLLLLATRSTMTTDLTKVNIPAFPKNTKDQVAVKTWRDEFIATCGLLNCRDVIKTGKVAAYSKDIVKERH